MYVDHDLTREERDVQKQIVIVTKKEKQEENIVKIGYRKLRKNGR